ncbi:hypothetical protein CEXT_530671 [Caerostris extrusa]|uniref:Uncharacterized protein n=1 Tax=Caerostris extrusa TaxID=172846 RepID=A0AAV4N659_CAEEX|nr:hypothetical protein CEXT_530671 [Caerostris extrusa]
MTSTAHHVKGSALRGRLSVGKIGRTLLLSCGTVLRVGATRYYPTHITPLRMRLPFFRLPFTFRSPRCQPIGTEIGLVAKKSIDERQITNHSGFSEERKKKREKNEEEKETIFGSFDDI